MRKRVCFAVVTISFLALTAFSQTVQAPPPEATAPAALTNADVISMVQLGLSSPVILAKMKASPVNFDTATPALVDLSKKGVPQEIVMEMISRPSGPPISKDAASPMGDAYASAMGQVTAMMQAVQHPVTFLADGKGIAIDPLTGRAQAVSTFMHAMVYMVYAGARAETRTKQKRPELRVRSNGNPSGHFYLVRTDVQAKEGRRSVKVGSGVFHYESGPDKDWCVDFALTKLNENEWSMIPAKDLKPGEYGVFNGYQLFDFGVDP